MAGSEKFTRRLAGAGTASEARRDRAPAPLVSCFATRAGKVAATDGRPGLGVCPPPGDGIVSQYWFSALSAGLVQPGTVAALAAIGAGTLNRRTTTPVRRKLGMSNLIQARC